ncbi:TPA: universal stress protein, partial [Enterobacter cloacae]|nr:universal stress protein [Enterobacter cloacae]HBB9956680.1 universal stress protein [Enterobacter cloacae]
FEMNLSDKAVRHAANLAKAEGASITLVNILPNSSRSLLRGFNADIRKFEEYMTAESSKKMKELTRLFDLSPEDIHCEVRFGNVRDEIIRMSKEGEYDVIVIGSKNPTITTHLLGSNAESILRYATIPVLVVR